MLSDFSFFSVFLLSSSISSASRLEAAGPETGPEAAQRFLRHSNARGSANGMETLETQLTSAALGYHDGIMPPNAMRYNGAVNTGLSTISS